MTTYLLDTNIVSHLIKGDQPAIHQHLLQVPMHCVSISAVTEAELRYGLAKRGHPNALSNKVQAFLIRVEVLPWTSEVAVIYGDLRAECEASGITLAPMDMMIAAHAKAAGAVLVTRDKIFAKVPAGLLVEDWASK